MRKVTIIRAGLTGLVTLAASGPALAQEGGEPWGQADEIWGEAEMAEAREQVLASHGDLRTSYFQAERFELQALDDEDVLVFDGNAWFGGENKDILIVEG